MPFSALRMRATGTGGGGGPTFSFQSDITRWWDVTQGVTLNTGEVTAWSDRIATTNMPPIDTSNKPNFSSTGINGNAGITCLNFNEGFSSPYASTDGTATFAIVASFTSASTAWGRIMSMGSEAAAGDEASSNYVTLVRNSSSSSVSLFRNSVSSGTHSVGYSTAVAFLIDLNGTDTKLYINNVLAGSIANNAAINIAKIGIFREMASSGWEDAKGTVGDIMVINRPLNSTERAELQTYWATKFGL